MSLEELDLKRVMARAPEERDLIRIIGRCDAIRPENRPIRRICEGLHRVGVLALSRGRYSLTSPGRGEYEALRRAGSMDMERVWEVDDT